MENQIILQGITIEQLADVLAEKIITFLCKICQKMSTEKIPLKSTIRNLKKFIGLHPGTVCSIMEANDKKVLIPDNKNKRPLFGSKRIKGKKI